jgi:amino acid transporter
MSSDGLLFKFLSTINEKTKTPFIAAIICGVCAGKNSFLEINRLKIGTEKYK